VLSVPCPPTALHCAAPVQWCSVCGAVRAVGSDGPTHPLGDRLGDLPLRQIDTVSRAVSRLLHSYTGDRGRLYRGQGPAIQGTGAGYTGDRGRLYTADIITQVE
jgi:hypothetical protein